MKKQEIKKDIIRDRIVEMANYISENIVGFWISIGIVIGLIFIITLFFNRKNNNLLESNLSMGLIQNRAINNADENDSLLLTDYKNILQNPISYQDYNQAFIYLLSDAIKKNDNDYIVGLLSENQFSSDDDMLNSFLYRMKATYLYSENISNCAEFYKKAINLVPSYDLKVAWASDLINLYIDQSNYKEADIILQLLKDLIEDEKNLSLSAKNDLDFIESRINQLIN